MLLYLFAFKKVLCKPLFVKSGVPEVAAGAGRGSGCVPGSGWFVTPEEFGYSRKQSAQCSHSSRNISGLCSPSASSLPGKRWISGLFFTTGCWAGTGNVGLTGAPSMFEAEIHNWGCL